MHSNALTRSSDGTMLTKTTKLVRWEALHWTWVPLKTAEVSPLEDHDPIPFGAPVKLKKAQLNFFTLPAGTVAFIASSCSKRENISQSHSSAEISQNKSSLRTIYAHILSFQWAYIMFTSYILSLIYIYIPWLEMSTLQSHWCSFPCHDSQGLGSISQG